MTSLTDLRPVFPNIVLMAGRPAERERDILRPEPARPYPHGLLITAGLADEIQRQEEDDNRRGYENAEDALHRWTGLYGATACDRCGKGDHDPTKPSDND